MYDAHSSNPEEPQALIRELRIKVGLLQSELEHLRREHAALKNAVTHDIAALARRYLEPAKGPAGPVRDVDGVIFGGWDRHEPGPDPAAGSARESRRA